MTIRLFMLSLLLPLGVFAQAADQSSESRRIENVYFSGDYPVGEGQSVPIASIGERKKNAGRLMVSPAGLAFYARIMAKFNRYALSYDFAAGEKVRSGFFEGDKLLAVEQNGRIYFFFREAGFDEDFKGWISRIHGDLGRDQNEEDTSRQSTK